MKHERHYGLFTAITMILGIVIGSGIFFKADDILYLSNGNILKGISIFVIAALSIVFGCLSLSTLAARFDIKGGIVSYFEECISPATASGYGWYQVFIYYPSINAIVSWVVILYADQFFGWNLSFDMQIICTALLILFLFASNFFSLRFGGAVQNLTATVKLIPLLIIAAAGLYHLLSGQSISGLAQTSGESAVGRGVFFLGALAPVAYAYDGWQISLAISTEIENPKRNVPRALVIAPLTVLIVYILYFVGIIGLIGPDQLLALGNNAPAAAAEKLFGNFGSRLIQLLIIVSVYGVVNGITLGFIRMPEAMALKYMLPGHGRMDQLHEKYRLSGLSCLFALALSLLWLFFHFLAVKLELLKNSDISEVAICFGLFSLIVLYFRVLRMYLKGEINSRFRGLIAPLLAILGSLSTLFGSFLLNAIYTLIFTIFCLVLCSLGYFYYHSQGKKRALIK
ncbi:MAG: APC family permease [Eubacteriales bacterium]|nr:APC family permease [Eubacteriales bacterium]